MAGYLSENSFRCSPLTLRDQHFLFPYSLIKYTHTNLPFPPLELYNSIASRLISIEFQAPSFKIKDPSSTSSKFRVPGPDFKFRVPSSEFRAPSSEFRAPSSEFRVSSSKFQVPSSRSEFQVPKFEFLEQFSFSEFRVRGICCQSLALSFFDSVMRFSESAKNHANWSKGRCTAVMKYANTCELFQNRTRINNQWKVLKWISITVALRSPFVEKLVRNHLPDFLYQRFLFSL